MTKIILISGKAESGKDTVASKMKDVFESKNLRVCTIKFGDYLKFVCGNYFGYKGIKDEVGRQILQDIGTNYVHPIDPYYWAITVKEFIRVFSKKFDVFIISDWRFKRELSALKSLQHVDVITIRINRLNHTSKLTASQLAHVSETELDNQRFGYVIDSDSLRTTEEWATIISTRLYMNWYPKCDTSKCDECSFPLCNNSSF